MAIEKVVVPVAGLGTRLLPATKSQPKEMLPVGRKPVVQYVVEELVSQGLKKFLFVTGKNKRSIEDHFDKDPELLERLRAEGRDELLDEMDYEREGVTFFYVRQRLNPMGVPGGLGAAVAAAEDFVGEEDFVVALGDTIITGGDYSGLIRRMVASHMRNRPAATVAVVEVPEDEVSKYGVVKPKKRAGSEFEAEDLVEKPPSGEAPSRLAIAARYVFSPVIFDAIRRTAPGVGGELQLTDAIANLIKMGHKVMCVKLKPDERRYDIGNPESYFKAFVDFALADQQYGYIIRQYLQRKLREV
ncbi:MAG: hypothetical protein DRP94_07870 [Candidatus Latescibacterota bacterium]|nr:MAG: hypothetical protein DRP94_07870 [Candidatus Latescibacterota bacterium]RKY64211.1 MAG: hypothetical protein DRQ08_08145 [Candidatus Latescibacterota bacterium]